MPSFAPQYTPRYRARYRAAGVEHSIQIRGPRGHSAFLMEVDGRNACFAVFNSITARLAVDHEWISAEVALTDEDTFSPAAVPAAVTGTVLVSSFTPVAKITAAAWSGRAPGSRSRVYAYGFLWVITSPGSISGDGLVTSGEEAGIATVATSLNGLARAGSGANAVWYNRVTVKPNDHLLKLVRRGIIT